MDEKQKAAMMERVAAQREAKREQEELLWDVYTRTLFLLPERKHEQSGEAA